MDIQRFSEGEEVVVEAEPVEVDVDAKIETAIAAVTAKLEAEYKQREAATKEAERLSKLSEDERAAAELERTRKELEEQRTHFEREKLKYEATKVVAQRGIPVEFTEYLIAESNEATLERIKTFEKAYRKAVEDGVNEKLKGAAPLSSGKAVSGKVTKGFLEAIRTRQIVQ